MKIWEIIKVALSSLKNNKLRSSLTVLGIVIGIFSIISISTVITMLQNSINEGLSQLGKNTFQIQRFPAIQMGRFNEKIRSRKKISIEEYSRLKEILVEAQSVGAEQWQFGRLVKSKWDATNPNVSVAGATPEAIFNNDWIVETGRNINQNDCDRGHRICVLGMDVANKIFKHIDPVGQEIKFDGLRLQVIGVFASKGQIFGESRDNFLVVPLSTFQAKYGRYTSSVNITVMAMSSALYNPTIEAAIGYMRTIRKVPVGEDNDFDIFSNESLILQVGQITRFIEIGAVVVALIALLAAGVGIMNIMLVSVTERTREIGIRKALGAKKRNILSQFLIEAITLCQVGGVMGIVLGLGAGNLAGSLLKAPPSLPINWIIIGVLMCVGIGIIFGTYPAMRAARLDPIIALRYE